MKEESENQKEEARQKVYEASLPTEERERLERAKAEQQAQAKVLEEKRLQDAAERKERMIVTTADLKQDYDVICPVYFQLNNRGKQFNELFAKYNDFLKSKENQMSKDQVSGLEIMQILFLDVGTNNGHQDFDKAFFIAVEELKERAALIGADAIVGMRQDIDLDSTGWQYFYLQMYGTAVKFK